MNLLPNAEKEILRKGLKLRLLISALLLLVASFAVGFVLLLPSFFLARSNFSEISLGNSSAKDEEKKELAAKMLNLPSEIDYKLKFLQANSNKIPVVDVISGIVKVLPVGVNIDSLSLIREQDYGEKKGTAIIISGVSIDRDSLVSFSSLLKESNLFTVVEMPVSSLTKERNLPFSMNLFIEN